MSVWWVFGWLGVLVALAGATAASVGDAGTRRAQQRRYRGRHGTGPNPDRARCGYCRKRVPVVCHYPACPEVTPLKVTYAEYIDISDHLK